MILQKLNFRYFFFLFVIYYSSFSQAVLPIEYFKKKKTLYKIRKFKHTNLDSLLYYSDKMKKSGNNCDKLIGLANESYFYYRQKKYDTVIKLVSRTIKEADSLIKENPSNLCYAEMKLNLTGRLFWTYRNLEKYNLAYEQTMKATQLINTIDNSKFNKFIYLTNFELFKAYIKNDLNLHVDSKYILKNLLKKIDTFEMKKMGTDYNKLYIERKTSSLNMIGESYFNLSEIENKPSYLDSASYFYKRAYLSGKKFDPPHPDSELMYQFKETKILIAKKEYSKALNLISDYKYPKLGKKINYQKESQYFRALCFHNLNQNDSAIYSAKKSIKNGNLKRSKLITLYDILSNQYLIKNKLDSALKYSKLTILEFNTAKTLKQKTYEILHDNDIKKITQLNNSILKKEQSRNLYTILIYAAIITLLSVVFISRRKKYKNQLSTIKIKSKEVNNLRTSQKSNYNIGIDLENKILNQIKDAESKHTYLDQNFSINTIAETIKTNVTYVSFIFNKHFDITFNQHFSKKRIEYAVEMLHKKSIHQKYSIEGIANEVGYKSAYAFSRAFKKQMNVSPSEYIKNLSK